MFCKAKIVVFLVAFFTATFGVRAHEYYLMPENFSAEAGEDLAVRHRLGQRFDGGEMPYIQRWNVRSEVWENGEMRAVKGLDGDRPALTIKPESDGLLTVVHQSNHSTLKFTTWEKFTAYVTKEGMTNVLPAHAERGLPQEAGVVEAYARFAKTLIAVGDGAGEDKPVGLKIELVALENPYTYDTAKPLPVQVLFDGKPLAGAAVKLFVGIDTERVGYFTTDANGEVEIPAMGAGPYLLNAIRMIEPVSDTPEAKDAMWESFWASMTFQRGR